MSNFDHLIGLKFTLKHRAVYTDPIKDVPYVIAGVATTEHGYLMVAAIGLDDNVSVQVPWTGNMKFDKDALAVITGMGAKTVKNITTKLQQGR